MPSERVALLAHGGFPDRAKTAVGVLRYGDQTVVAVLDRERAGDSVRDHLEDVPDAPIVAGIDDAPELDALLIGVAPIGGGFDPSWRPDVVGALERGCDVVAGLHVPLAEDDQFAALADGHGCSIRDVREPPADLTVSEGRAAEVDATVALTVGTDCSTGKMTTAMELRAAARNRGVDTTVVPTGQTGILIEGWGIAVDRTVSDFTAGAVERMVREAATDHDLLIVEGQGALGHPAYSAVTAGVVHGAMPDAMVLCHAAGRGSVHGYDSYPLLDPGAYARQYERFAAPVADSTVVAGSLNTGAVDGDGQAHEAVDAYADAIAAPASDPLRFGSDPILDAVL